MLLLASVLRSRSPVVGVPGLCWMWHGVPFARQRRPLVGVLGVVLVVAGSGSYIIPLQETAGGPKMEDDECIVISKQMK